MAITKIGTPELFDFSATNTALQLPTGTTAERPAAPVAGEWRYNTTLKYVEYYDGAAWFLIDTEAAALIPSENFNTSTYFGNGATQKLDAKFNEAANFNGASSNGSEISIADANVFSPVNNNLSFSCWIKTTVGNRYIASKLDDGGGSYEWGFFSNTNGTIQILCHSSGGSGTAATVASSQTTALDGNWNQVGFVIDYGNSVTVYVNGVGTTSTSWSGIMTNTSVPVLLGAATNIPAARMLGSIDQVRFFNTALTDAQAEDCYTDETTTTAATLDFPAGAGCIAAYQLDGNGDDLSTNYNGTTTNIGYTGLKFQPDFVWVKNRNRAGNSHELADSVRGVNNTINSNTTGGQYNNTTYQFNSFNSNSFTVTDDSAGNYAVNGDNETYVSWSWYAPTAESISASGSQIASTVRKNVDAGFSIVQGSFATGEASTKVVGHGLTSPKLIIYKATNIVLPWFNFGVHGGSVFGNNNVLRFNTDAAANDSTFDITGTTFKVGSTGAAHTFIAYCFENVAGYQSVGSYTGNRPSTKTVYTTDDGTSTGANGFEPSFLMIKDATTAAGEDWIIVDNKREGASAPTKVLYPNTNASEDAYTVIAFTSNGFTVGDTGLANTNGATIIYLAIA